MAPSHLLRGGADVRGRPTGRRALRNALEAHRTQRTRALLPNP